MKDMKLIVAQNLGALRKKKGITQAQLAEEFNYSDKAVCRWEHGDTLPDINVLCALCDYYGITMNDLVDPQLDPDRIDTSPVNSLAYKIWLCALLGTVVWFCATVFFVSSLTLFHKAYWVVFVYAVPLTCLVVLKSLKHVMNWIGKIITASILSWSAIAAVYLHILVGLGANIWYLFFIGLPLEAFTFQWYRLRSYRERF